MAYLEPRDDAPAPTQTAIIAAVPEADPLVAAHRSQFDVAAGWGVPAHVTVCYPFVPPLEVTQRLITRLGELVAAVPAFDLRFTEPRWFGQDVIWLHPEPAEPFRQLTAAVWEAFPKWPPYGGAYEDPIPHLTVAERQCCDVATLRAVERSVQPRLPVSARLEELLFIAGAPEPDSWRVLHRLPLGTSLAEG